MLGLSLSEGSGQVVNDSTIFRNNGVLGTSAVVEAVDPTWAAGYFTNGLSFNGFNSRVTIPDSSSLRLSGATTLEARIFAAARGSKMAIVSRSSLQFRGFSMFVTAGGGLGATCYDPAGAGYTFEPLDGRIPVGQWVHVAVVFDPTARTMRTFVNGAMSGGTFIGTSLTAPVGAPLTIGTGDGGQPFNGRIDEVAVYGRALSPAEITSRAALTP